MNSRINDWYTNEVLGKWFGNNLDTVGAPAAWSRGYTGAGSKIAIFDTGIDLDHPEFEEELRRPNVYQLLVSTEMKPLVIKIATHMEHM